MEQEARSPSDWGTIEAADLNIKRMAPVFTTLDETLGALKRARTTMTQMDAQMKAALASFQ